MTMCLMVMLICGWGERAVCEIHTELVPLIECQIRRSENGMDFSVTHVAIKCLIQQEI